MSIDPKSSYYDHGGIEVIDVIQAKLTTEQFQGYLLGNVIKYSLRANWKGDSLRDAGKLRIYAELLLDEMMSPPAERQEQVRERYTYPVDDQRPPDRPIASHCPDGGACRHKCGLEPCKEASA